MAAKSRSGHDPRPIPPAETLALERTPGHLIRRIAQVHKALWISYVSDTLTSPQYAVLVALHREPGIDQRRLGSLVSLDRSTTADVVARLADRRFVVRVRDDADRRRNVLVLSADGENALAGAAPAVAKLRRLLLQPLQEREGASLIELLDKVVNYYDELGTTVDPD